MNGNACGSARAVLYVSTVFDQREFDHLHIAVVVEVPFLVPHISDTTAHASGEVAPCTSENHHASSGHIFAAVVADPFHDSDSTGVAHAETFAYTSVDIYFATCRPVYQGVSGNRVVLGYEVDRTGGITLMRPPLKPLPK